MVEEERVVTEAEVWLGTTATVDLTAQLGWMRTVRIRCSSTVLTCKRAVDSDRFAFGFRVCREADAVCRSS